VAEIRYATSAHYAAERYATSAHTAAEHYATSAHTAAEHSEFLENRRREDGASTQLHFFFNQRHGPTQTSILVSTLFTYRETV
jgi:hypothetical protein